MELNQDFFNRTRTVQEYQDYYTDLIAPESHVLQWVQTQRVQTFLDIGIGAGRTTAFFAPAVSNYIGVDYAENMVQLCGQRFGSSLAHARFLHDDARALSKIPDASIDFAFFSFNGIDCVSPDDRRLVLQTVFKKLKSGGVFCFSAHHLAALPDLYRWHWKLSPILFAWEIIRNFKIRKLNPPLKQLLSLPEVAVYDGVHQFKIAVVYVRPDRQVRDLQDAGFTDVKVWLPEQILPQPLQTAPSPALTSITYWSKKP